MSHPLWTPSADHIAQTHMARFMSGWGAHLGRSFDGYDDLWDASVSDIPGFWDYLWDHCGVIGDKHGPILENADDIENARFFPDAKINFAENLLRRTGDGLAIISYTEDGIRTQMTYDDLHAQVSVIQQAMRGHGIAAGDRVAGYVPNGAMTVAIALAATSLGAVWSSCSPDFGTKAALDRFGQVAPKMLFCADGYRYNGKLISSLETASDLTNQIGSIEKTIAFPFANTGQVLPDNITNMDDFTAGYAAQTVTFDRRSFGAPLFIMFTSGTTGLPKSIVHSVGGTTLQHMKEHKLHCDVRAGDKMFFYTTCGWMMWNWLISALMAEATLVLYDGSPFYPEANRLPDLIDADDITHFGTSAKYVDFCAKQGLAPKDTHGFKALRAILTTGSPLSDPSFEYLYADWKPDMQLASIAGGTDILGCFVGGSPISPVYAGACQKRLLGMDVQVFDDAGLPMTTGQGELVCCKPHPSQPSGFWNDPDGSKYHNAYFAKFANTWHHGDLVALTPEGGVRFYGRSDAVLNPGGVRIGTAEIYRQLDKIPQVSEGVVVGQNWDNDVRVVLFVRLADGIALDDDLIKTIKTEIRKNATPRHVPAIILQVEDIPRTKSGKVAEIAVRDTIHGRAVKNTGSLANPQSLDLYKNLAALS
ncbi:MAG: acetoacetate--CoA ligase [Planktomarina sp.]